MITDEGRESASYPNQLVIGRGKLLPLGNITERLKKDGQFESLNEKFETTAAFEWLKVNAHKYGFILRYPKGQESVTGYDYEPWHFRFVGRQAASEMYYMNMTLEEYLSDYRNIT